MPAPEERVGTAWLDVAIAIGDLLAPNLSFAEAYTFLGWSHSCWAM
jgi:hypothetical protein